MVFNFLHHDEKLSIAMDFCVKFNKKDINVIRINFSLTNFFVFQIKFKI